VDGSIRTVRTISYLFVHDGMPQILTLHSTFILVPKKIAAEDFPRKPASFIINYSFLIINYPMAQMKKPARG